MRWIRHLLPACTLLAVPARGDLPIPLARSASESRQLAETASASGKVIFSDLQQQDKGTLFSTRSDTVLPPGRYRLHAPLAMAPLGDPRLHGVAVTLKAGRQQRTVHPVQFPASDTFADITLDFAVDESSKPAILAEWEAGADQQARKGRQTLKPPEAPRGDAMLDILGGAPDADAAALLLAAEGDAVPLERARQVDCRLMARPPHLEALAPVACETVATDRITYRPGQTGAVTVVLRNAGREAARAEVSIDLLDGFSRTTRLHRAAIDFKPLETITWTGTFDTAAIAWGAEIAASATCPPFESDRRSAVFGVRSNFWDLALMTSHQNLGLIGRALTPGQARAAMRGAVAQGFTGFEAFFWAPCDMIDFTPDTETFFGCQGGHRFSASGTSNLVAEAHAAGMAATVYANLWGAGGPAGMELMRQHPDWFGQAEAAAYHLDDWPLMDEGRMNDCGVWMHNQANLANADPLFQRHIDEIIASHRQFGWDGTRYDSYYSADWTKAATAKIRAAVEAAIPGYRWGYNSIAASDAKAKALDIMVGGGGLVMEEGLGRISDKGGTLGDYAALIVRYRDLVWPHGGHLSLIYGGGMAFDAVLMSSVLLAGGCHPYYNRLEADAGDHPRFALRYSEVLWNTAMRPLRDPEGAIAIPDAGRFLRWRDLARTVSLGGRRQRLVLHFINAAAGFAITGKEATAVPAPAALAPPVSRLPVTVTLPPDARADRVWTLSAVPAPGHAAAPFRQEDKAVRFEIPDIRFWSVAVIDYEADHPLEAAPP